MASVPFNNLITFSRGSNATLVDATGKIAYAPNNLLTFSEQFDNAAWVKQGVGVATAPTVTANAGVAPDGTSTAERIQFSLNAGTATGDISQIFQSVTFTSAPAIFSVYLKSNTSSSFNMQITNPNGTPTNITVTPEWRRFNGVSAIAPGAVNYQIRLRGGQSPANSNTADILVWGAQLELGSTATTYNSTTVKNLLGFSEAFDNAAWTKTRASIVTGAQANPVNGMFNAQKLMEDTTASNSHRVNSGTVTVATGSTVTVSVYLKAAGRTWCRIADGGVTASGAYVNLATGQFGTISAGVTRSSIVSIGDGWYRVSITGVLSGSLSQLFVDLATGDNVGTYTGDGNSGVYIYGAQLSDSASLDPYVPTPAAAPSSTAYYGPRFDYDPVTLQPKGLLVEEQRTNLLLRSAEFDNATWQKSTGGVASAPAVTADFGASPDGTNNADRVQFALNGGTTSTDRSLLSQTVTIVNATSYTFSVWLRSLSGTVAMGIGCDGIAGNTPITVTSTWQRFTLTGTSTGIAGLAWVQLRGAQTATQTNAADVLVWGAQLEAGAFATSYIPTIASQVTRSADVATISGSLFSQWYKQTAGTFVAQGSGLVGSGSAVLMAARTSGGSNLAPQLDILSATSTRAVYTDAAGTIVATNTATVGSTASSNKYAAAVNASGAAVVANGGTIVSSAISSIPTPTVFCVGGLQTTQFLNGHIRSINYIPARAADFQLQALTT